MHRRNLLEALTRYAQRHPDEQATVNALIAFWKTIRTVLNATVGRAISLVPLGCLIPVEANYCSPIIVSSTCGCSWAGTVMGDPDTAAVAKA